MLARVSAALSQLISPLSSQKSESKSEIRERKEGTKAGVQGFEQFKDPGGNSDSQNPYDGQQGQSGSPGDSKNAKPDLRLIPGGGTPSAPPRAGTPLSSLGTMPNSGGARDYSLRANLPSNATEDESELSIAHSFFRIFNLFAANRIVFLRKRGPSAYQTSLLTQRRSALYKKGAMVDIKAE